jgi:hypothetical protein
MAATPGHWLLAASGHHSLSPCIMSPCFPDVASVLGLGSLCRCWIPVSPDISSQTTVPPGFFIQHCPCLVPDDRVSWAVQEWHGGSSVCGRWPTCFGTHHRPGSVSSAVCGALTERWRSTCAPKASTATSSLGTSWCPAAASFSSGFELKYMVLTSS